MVFYAGRGVDFSSFVEALSGAARTCRNQPLTVLTAATGGFTTTQEYDNTLASNNIKFVVATASDSSSWGKNEPGTPPGYPAFLTAYRDRGFVNDADLLDGYAIAHHDALATAVKAIRLAAMDRQTQAPNSEDVASRFGQLNLAHAVPAASGTLSFTPEGGRAADQAIPIKQIG
jgi:hypothetical protein